MKQVILYNKIVMHDIKKDIQNFHIFCNNQLYYNIMWWLGGKTFGLWPRK
jgi:uncharacterized membrane protein SpoIIM required for sporulation